MLRFFADYTDHAHRQDQLPGVFPDDALLVPVPGSSPHLPGQVSKTEHIARELYVRGLAAGVREMVKRRASVSRSSRASSRAEGRPTLDRHVATLDLIDQDEPLLYYDSFVLVDDVVTSGTTMLAVAFLLHRAYPRMGITCFAVARVDRNHAWGLNDEALLPAVEVIRSGNDGYGRRR